jgi:hypothetical protein
MSTYHRLGNATFSDCGRYRYLLNRKWAEGPACLFVGLNPSTANANENDATVRNCITLATTWGFSEMTIANLFAIRCRYPHILSTNRDPVGPENDRILTTAIRNAQTAVAMWGNHGLNSYGLLPRRDEFALPLHNNWQCIGITKQGAPRHPLYAAKTSTLMPFRRL